MDAVTHSNEEVIRLMNDLFVPVRIDSSRESGISKLYRVESTPTYVAIDSRKKEHFRWSGFSNPEDFSQTLRLMSAAAAIDRRSYDFAIEMLSSIVDSPSSPSTPDALYLLGVARYKKSGDFQQAVDQWRRLKLSYPDHPLIKKVNYAL